MLSMASLNKISNQLKQPSLKNSNKQIQQKEHQEGYFKRQNKYLLKKTSRLYNKIKILQLKQWQIILKIYGFLNLTTQTQQ
jgi:hypothetical protein